VPRVKEVFGQGGKLYLIQDYIEGRTLADVANDDISRGETLKLAHQICQVVSSIHDAGWAWRDCKLMNFIYDGTQTWAIDMEFALRIGKSVRSFRGTRGYCLEQPEPISGYAAELQDRYALGVSLQRLFGKGSEKSRKFGVKKPPLPDDLDPVIRNMILALQNRRPDLRLSAAAAAKVMTQYLG